MTQTKHIEMRNVRKAFRFFTLEDLSLDLEPGQIMGFVGPNGAGKSTTIRLLTGLLAPDAGEIRVLGHAMPEGQALAKRDIGFVSDEMRLFGHATLGWHMQFVASIYPGWDAQYAKTLVKRFNLRPEQNVSGLSSGEHVKAVLLLALARRPRLLILDEPTSGLDPVARHELLSEFMDVLRDEDRSILFSSHNTVDVERISDRITFIDRGRLVDSSDKEDFLERWRRIQLQLPAGATLPDLPHVVSRVVDGQFVTLTTNRFSPDLARIPGHRRSRSAAHEPRGDLRRERHASPGAARPMNMLTRKLIAKDFYLNRWLIIGSTVAGLVGLADRRRRRNALQHRHAHLAHDHRRLRRRAGHVRDRERTQGTHAAVRAEPAAFARRLCAHQGHRPAALLSRAVGRA